MENALIGRQRPGVIHLRAEAEKEHSEDEADGDEREQYVRQQHTAQRRLVRPTKEPFRYERTRDKLPDTKPTDAIRRAPRMP